MYCPPQFAVLTGRPSTSAAYRQYRPHHSRFVGRAGLVLRLWSRKGLVFGPRRKEYLFAHVGRRPKPSPDRQLSGRRVPCGSGHSVTRTGWLYALRLLVLGCWGIESSLARVGLVLIGGRLLRQCTCRSTSMISRAMSTKMNMSLISTTLF
jgi:hypothetical protein